MVLYKDEVLKWIRYEQTKDKNFIDFSKNPKVKEKFENLVKSMKQRLADET